jgi:rhodanese-related sulfurtransferase
MERLIEFAGNHPWLVSAAVATLLLALVFEYRSRAESAAAVSPQDLIRLQNQGALVLDIRPPDQFAAGHVAGARHMPSDQILKAAETLKKHREKPVIVYCESGSLSAAAVRQLGEQGFTKALNLRGGLAGWRAENMPVAKA